MFLYEIYLLYFPALSSRSLFVSSCVKTKGFGRIKTLAQMFHTHIYIYIYNIFLHIHRFSIRHKQQVNQSYNTTQAYTSSRLYLNNVVQWAPWRNNSQGSLFVRCLSHVSGFWSRHVKNSDFAYPQLLARDLVNTPKDPKNPGLKSFDAESSVNLDFLLQTFR